MCESQFETETWKEKHTQNPRHSYNQNQMDSFPGVAGQGHLSSTPPFSGRLDENNLEGGRAGSVRKEAAPEPHWLGPPPSSKPASPRSLPADTGAAPEHMGAMS